MLLTFMEKDIVEDDPFSLPSPGFSSATAWHPSPNRDRLPLYFLIGLANVPHKKIPSKSMEGMVHLKGSMRVFLYPRQRTMFWWI